MNENLRANFEGLLKSEERKYEMAKAEIVRRSRELIRDLERAIEAAESDMMINSAGIVQSAGATIDRAATEYVRSAQTAEEFRFYLRTECVRDDGDHAMADYGSDYCAACLEAGADSFVAGGEV